jgi:hypothetical protein
VTTLQKRGNFAVVGSGTMWDGIAYWAIVGGVYLMVGGLFFYSGKEKLFDDHGHPPAAIKQQFDHSFLGTFSGRPRPGSSRAAPRSTSTSVRRW